MREPTRKNHAHAPRRSPCGARRLIDRGLSLSLLVILLTGGSISVDAAGKGKKYYEEGQKLEAAGKVEQAVEKYLLALNEADRPEYRIAYRRASLQASLYLVRRGRELMEQGQWEDAYHAFRRAYQYDQTNELARDFSRKLLEKLRTEGQEPNTPSSPFGSTEPPVVQRGRARSEDQKQAAAKEPAKDVRQTIIFHDQLKAVITQIAKQLGINVAFDQSVQDRRLDIELQDITLAKALDTILVTNGLFFQPINENSIIVAQDQPVNRNRLQQMSVQTFYLKNLDAQQLAQVQQVLTMFFGQRVQSWPMQDMRAMIVRTAPENMKLVSEIIETIDKEKPQVMIDVSIYEVSRNDLMEIGNQLLFDGFLGQGATSGPLRPGTLNLLGITAGQILTEQRLALAVPTSIIRALQTRGNSRLIDSIQVHALDGQQVTANIGRSIPIQTASLPTSFVNVNPAQPNQPGTPPGGFGNIFGFGFPQIEYRDVGLNVTITPTIYTDEDIKLEMQVETSGFVEGPTQLTPIITRRSLKSVATVKTGQAAMMAGVAQRRNEQTRGSLPLLGFLPVVGRFFSIPKETGSTTDLLITVTPHIVRAPTIEDRDRLARLAGTLQAQGVNETIENFVQRMQARRMEEQSPAIAAAEGSKAEPTAPSREANPAASGTEAGAIPVAVPPMASGEAIAATLQLINTTPPRVNELLQVAVFLNSPEAIKEATLVVTYNPTFLRWVRASEGGLLSTTDVRAEIESTAGPDNHITLTVRTSADARPARGRLAILYFDVLASGNSQIEIDASRSRFLTGDGRTVGCRSIPLTVSAR